MAGGGVMPTPDQDNLDPIDPAALIPDDDSQDPHSADDESADDE